ncbi:MAG: replicative DNA helicase [Candidatus Heimdallarchaeaceae archaeon]
MNLKNLPQEINAEQACLGSCLLDEDAFVLTVETLSPDDFYKNEHKMIYRMMVSMLEMNVNIDLITITSALKEAGKLDKIGGVIYLTQLINSVPTVKNIEHYIALIQKVSIQRARYGLLTSVNDGTITVDSALTKLETLNDIKVKEETLQMLLEKTLSNVVQGTEFTFGINSLNKYIGGIDKGELLTIGGWTSQGKSILGLQMAINQCKQGKNVLFLSTEMTPQEVSRRLLGNLELVPIMRIRKNELTDEERNRLGKRAKEISGSWKLNIKKVFSMDDARKYVRKYDPHFLVFDYLQNLGEQDYASTSRNILELQRLTLQKSLATICLSQFNRNNEEVREPKLSDLRQSGRIEECSNIVLLLYWKERLQRTNAERLGGEEPEEMKILISKNRDGTIGRLGVNLFPEYSRMEHIPVVQYQPNLYQGGGR